MKPSLIFTERGALRFLSATLMLLLTGCAAVEDSFTYKLWHNESFRNFNEPASDPHLALFADTPRADVLVQYDEVREKDGRARRRAFFVNANRRRIEAGLKPRFVSAKAASGLTPIPILRSGDGQPTPPSGLCVVMETNQHSFILRSDGQVVNAVTLPTYGTTGGVKKAFLTPLTVTGDTLVVGVIAGIIVAHAWAHSGYPGIDCR